MVARLIRTLLAQSLLHASLLLRQAGTRLLPGNTLVPPSWPAAPHPEDVPPMVVQIPPEAQEMLAGRPTAPKREEEAPPLAGSLAARRQARGLA